MALQKIIADEGKIFIRKDTREVYGREIFLGYTYYIKGVLLDPPHQDTIDDFEEVDDPDYVASEVQEEKEKEEL